MAFVASPVLVKQGLPLVKLLLCHDIVVTERKGFSDPYRCYQCYNCLNWKRMQKEGIMRTMILWPKRSHPAALRHLHLFVCWHADVKLLMPQSQAWFLRVSTGHLGVGPTARESDRQVWSGNWNQWGEWRWTQLDPLCLRICLYHFSQKWFASLQSGLCQLDTHFGVVAWKLNIPVSNGR